jgi:hypothetical protein
LRHEIDNQIKYNLSDQKRKFRKSSLYLQVKEITNPMIDWHQLRNDLKLFQSHIEPNIKQITHFSEIDCVLINFEDFGGYHMFSMNK